MRREHRLGSAREMARAVAESLREHLVESVEMLGQASLVLPGGPSSSGLFEALREESLPWPELTVTLTDECWVPVEDGASREGIVRRTLLQGEASAASFVGLKTAGRSPEEAAEEVDARLAALVPFDAVVLTLGEGGEVAALLPDAPQIEAAVDLESSAHCLALHSPSSPHPRLSMTLAALLYSRRRYLVLNGEEGWAAYQEGLAEGSVEDLPLRGILHPHSRALEVFCTR